MAYIPYIPECMCDSPPPLVFIGSDPPGAVLRSRTKSPASPRSQKLRSFNESTNPPYGLLASCLGNAAGSRDCVERVTRCTAITQLCRWFIKAAGDIEVGLDDAAPADIISCQPATDRFRREAAVRKRADEHAIGLQYSLDLGKDIKRLV